MKAPRTRENDVSPALLKPSYQRYQSQNLLAAIRGNLPKQAVILGPLAQPETVTKSDYMQLR